MNFGDETIPGISVRQVLRTAEIIGLDDLRVRSCCADSRSCQPGDLFVALPGARHDGHDYVLEAQSRGAAAVVVNRPVPGCRLPVVYIDDTRDAYGRLCQALMGSPSARLKTIGIAGSLGKTTTAWLTAGVLEAGGYPAAVSSSLGHFDGQQVLESAWTTPPAELLAGWLARAAAHGCSHAVVETSQRGLTQSRVAGVEFDLACFSNIRHYSVEHGNAAHACRTAMGRLLDHLRPEGFVIINVDDPGAASLLPLVDGPVMTVGCQVAAEVSAVPLELYPSEQTFLLSAGRESVPVRSPLVGRHNLSNCLMAAAVGLVYGMSLEQVVAGLESIQLVPRRLERIECGQPFSTFVDQAPNADALANVLDTLREATSGRLICVFDANQPDRASRRQIAQVVASRADVAMPATGPAVTASGGRPVGCDDAHAHAMQVERERRRAIDAALRQAAPGDCVLVAGDGDEADFIRQWLYDQARRNDRRLSA